MACKKDIAYKICIAEDYINNISDLEQIKEKQNDLPKE